MNKTNKIVSLENERLQKTGPILQRLSLLPGKLTYVPGEGLQTVYSPAALQLQGVLNEVNRYYDKQINKLKK